MVSDRVGDRAQMRSHASLLCVLFLVRVFVHVELVDFQEVRDGYGVILTVLARAHLIFFELQLCPDAAQALLDELILCWLVGLLVLAAVEAYGRTMVVVDWYHTDGQASESFVVDESRQWHSELVRIVS